MENFAGSPGQKVEAHSARMHLRSTFAEKCKETPLPSHVKDMASVPGIDVENNVDSDESEQQSHHQEDQGAHEPMREDESLAVSGPLLSMMCNMLSSYAAG